MKKFKNIKLMLIGLFALVGMNAFAQKYYPYENLLYVQSADNVTNNVKEVNFVGLLDNITLKVEDGAANDETTINVPATIAPTDGEGNPMSFKVVGIEGTLGKWTTAQTGLGAESYATQAIGADLKTLTFADGVKLKVGQVRFIFTPSFLGTNLETLSIADGRNVPSIGNGTDPVNFLNTIKTLNIAGLTNDVDGDVEIADGLFWGAEKLTSVSLPTKSPVIIGESAFRGTLGLKSITLTGVKEIGANAFKSSALTSLSIPASVEAIGENAFDVSAAGGKLTTVTIDAGEKLTTIPAAFGAQDAITSVTVKGKATTIASGAFADAKNIETIDLSGASELKTINGAFDTPSVNNKLKKVLLAGTKIEGGLFAVAGITALEEYTFPTTLKGTLPSFSQCTGLKKISAIPAQVTEIPANGFFKVGKLTEIDLSGAAALKTIGTQAFAYCESLKSMDFSNTLVGAIPDGAFWMERLSATTETKGYTKYPDGKWYKFNTALEKVTLKDVTDLKGSDGKDIYATFTIGKQAFLNTANLGEVVNLDQKKVEFTGSHAFCYSGIKKADFTKAVIKNDDGEYTSLVEIPAGTFFAAINLEEVTLPEGISVIGDNAFQYCSKLAKLNDNGFSNLSEIGVRAFYGDALTALDLTSATGKDASDNYLFTTIKESAFAKNASLATVKLPAQLSVIEPGAFAFATSLSSINLNQTSVTGLENIFTYDSYAPSGKKNDNPEEISLDKLTSLELVKDAKVTVDGEALPEIQWIEDYALQFTGLTSIVIPSSVWDMGDGVLRGCVTLTDFEWKNVDPLVTTLPDETFRGDVKLANVTFLALAKTSDLDPIKDKEVFFMCDKDLLKVYLTPDHYNVTVAAGYGNDNRTYSTLDVEGNVQFAFSEKGLASDGYYYATYYNEVNASWFDATKFDVFSAVVDGNKVVLKAATADGGYYKVGRFDGTNAKKTVCVVRSKDIKAVPELKSNDGSEYLSTFGDSQLNVSGAGGAPLAKGSKLNYIFKLSNVKGNVAFYRVTSGTFAAGKVYIMADPSAARLDIVVEGEGAITGIENIFSAEEDNAPIYNLQGVQVKEAKNGMFIKNGKKYIVK